MSMTVRPVTQLAEVDMKRASRNAMDFPTLAAGIMSRKVPVRMRRANPRAETRAGDLSKRMDNCFAIVILI
jgi:hypothetical protein